MEAYQHVVGGMRDLAHKMHGTQAGDPSKAARAIELALAADTGFRSALIQSPWSAHAEQLLKDLAAWEKVASDTQIGLQQFRALSY